MTYSRDFNPHELQVVDRYRSQFGWSRDEAMDFLIRRALADVASSMPDQLQVEIAAKTRPDVEGAGAASADRDDAGKERRARRRSPARHHPPADEPSTREGIFEMVRNAGKGGIARAEIVARTGLNKFTVSNQLKRLRAAGVVVLTGTRAAARWTVVEGASLPPVRSDTRKRRQVEERRARILKLVQDAGADGIGTQAIVKDVGAVETTVRDDLKRWRSLGKVRSAGKGPAARWLASEPSPDAPPPPQAAGPVTVRGGAGAPAETPTPRQSALADRAEVEKFVRENGARRFEPGTIDSLALAAFEASGMTAALKYDKSVRFWLIDGERRTYASGIDTANRLRAKRGLEPLTQRSGLEAA